MSGTRVGGLKAAATMKSRYGHTYYQVVGSEGGKKSRGGGFTHNRELAREAGRKGGLISRRGQGAYLRMLEQQKERMEHGNND